jgi:SAM-dependent methyltransferase
MARVLPAARRLRFALAISAVEQFARGRPLAVLDAGCGDGLLAQMLVQRHPECQVVGADNDPARLGLAEERARRAGLTNIVFQTLDLTEGLGEKRFDVVMAIETLEEIVDDHRALAAMTGALRPGGLLIAHVPDRDWEPLLPGSERVWRHEVRHGYGKDEIREMLERAGLRPVRLQATSHALVQLAQDARDRTRNSGPRTALLIHPLALAAAELERRGLRLGRARAWLAEAMKPLI